MQKSSEKICCRLLKVFWLMLRIFLVLFFSEFFCYAAKCEELFPLNQIFFIVCRVVFRIWQHSDDECRCTWVRLYWRNLTKFWKAKNDEIWYRRSPCRSSWRSFRRITFPDWYFSLFSFFFSQVPQVARQVFQCVRQSPWQKYFKIHEPFRRNVWRSEIIGRFPGL